MSNGPAFRWYRAGLVVADAACLGLAFLLAGQMRYALDMLPTPFDLDMARYGVAAAWLIPSLLVLFWFQGAYDAHYLLGGPDEYRRVASACTYGSMIAVAVSFLAGSTPLVSRAWLLLFWVSSMGLVSFERFALRRLAYRLRRHGWFVRRALVLGAGDHGLTIADQLHAPLRQGLDVIGFLDDYAPVGTQVSANQGDWQSHETVPFTVLGHPRDAASLAAEHSCDLLIAVSSSLSWESQQVLAQLAQTPHPSFEIRLAPTAYDLTTSGVESAPLGFVPLLRVQPTRVTSLEALMRSTVDLSLALLLLLGALPILAWLAVGALHRGIWPMLIARHVHGQGEQPVTFHVLDPRITDQVFLRGVPALVAVLRGHLALVGPRPVTLEGHAAYQPLLGTLLAAKPGLTGPWRLTRSTSTIEEQMLADAWWVRNWTIWQHLFVLIQSAYRLLGSLRRPESLARWDGHALVVRQNEKALVGAAGS